MNWSILARLTLCNAVVNASIIVVLGAVVYFALAKALLVGVDAVLAFDYRETVERYSAAQAARMPDGLCRSPHR